VKASEPFFLEISECFETHQNEREIFWNLLIALKAILVATP